MNIKTIPIDDLKPYAHNPKTHPAEQVEKIAKSIEEFGFLVPILIDADNSIIAGHGRLMAARKLGLAEIPTIRIDHLTEAQIRAYRIADNKLTESDWDLKLLESEMASLQDMDFDIDLTGFDENELKETTDEMFSLEDFEFEEVETPCWFVIRGDLKDYPELLNRINDAVSEFDVVVEDSQDG